DIAAECVTGGDLGAVAIDRFRDQEGQGDGRCQNENDQDSEDGQNASHGETSVQIRSLLQAVRSLMATGLRSRYYSRGSVTGSGGIRTCRKKSCWVAGNW